MGIAIIVGVAVLFFGWLLYSLVKLNRDDKKRLQQEAANTQAAVAAEVARISTMTVEEREQEIFARVAAEQEEKRVEQDRMDSFNHGSVNPVMLCPHCGEKGKVRTKAVELKKGVSGGKATAALLTGGVSLLATGLSRKETNTEAWCGNCLNRWVL